MLPPWPQSSSNQVLSTLLSKKRLLSSTSLPCSNCKVPLSQLTLYIQCPVCHIKLWSLGDKVKSFQVSIQIPAWKSLAESISVLPSPNTGSRNTTHLSEDIFTMHEFKFCVSLPLTFAFSTSSNVKTLFPRRTSSNSYEAQHP